MSKVNTYFLICLDRINYLYSIDLNTIQIISDIVALKKIRLQSMLDAELFEIIQNKTTNEFQSFHGSVLLYNKFCAA